MSEDNPTAPQAQQFSADLFGHESPADPTSIVGLRIVLQTPCPSCTRNVATIGEGKGPHKASMHCTACERHRGWVSVESFNFILDLVRQFGRPTEPIVVRTPRDGGENEAVHQTEPNRS